MNWIEAGAGYEVALDDALKLICRNSKQKVLASVPKAARESPAAEQLVGVKEWLAVHHKECAETVQRWMLRSLPVPREALVSVWTDPAWRKPLANLVAVPVEGDRVHWDRPGILRDASQERGLGLVDLDGESQWVKAPTVLFPHPILLESLSDFRELLTELQLSQETPQLFRECWPLPAGDTKSVSELANGKFQQMIHAHGRARTLGYPVRGGFATCAVWHAGDVIEARYWVGAGSPEEETWTGELCWVNRKEKTISAQEAGPVAYSEGMRMASQIYAGRFVEKEESA